MILETPPLNAGRGRAPRASGDDPGPFEYVVQVQTVLPARAGMIPRTLRPTVSFVRAPRASGDDPCAGGVHDTGESVLPARAGMILIALHLKRQPTWCSPRERG